MRQQTLKAKAGLAILGVAALLVMGGCQDAAKRPAQVRPPMIDPPAQAALEAPLPLNSRPVQSALLSMKAPNGLDRLIGRVEAAFRAGEEEYKAGHLVKARTDFDQAVDDLLSSGFDLNSEPRLAGLFDHIVEAIHGYEMVAFRDGDGFSEQKSEPAPIEEIASMTFPTESLDPRLRGSAEGELQSIAHDLPLTVNDIVLSYLNFFQTPRGSAIVETGLRRAGRYRAMISRVLREVGLPQDLIYLAQAESAFQPQALSRAGARGLWQFMSYSGRKYGLRHTWWVDDRQDPEKATRAAAEHLRDLYEEFGDWYLVMAAYDSGPGTVERAIQRTGYADFWELYKRNVLPRETRNYVPIILALTLISKDPARYGIDAEPEPPVRTDTVKPGHPIDLRLVAETIDADLDTLRSLNPQLLRLVTPNDPDFVLHLPEGSAERFYAEIAAIPPEKWVSWRRHRVEEGETLSGIARKYRVNSAAIAEANGIESHTPLRVGEKLIIPVAARPQPALGKLIHYRARRGDTLNSIADQFDVTVAELKRWNRLRSNRVVRGMRLRVYPGGMSPPPALGPRSSDARGHARTAPSALNSPEPGGTIVHRVKQGETLWSIARAYRTTVEALRSTNHFLFSRPLQAGDQIMILPPR